MNEETEKTILRRLANLETHIINLIIPIQQLCSVLTDREKLSHLEKLLSQPLKIEDNGFICLVRQLEILLKDVNKNVEKLDMAQTYGEIKFIGKKLHQIEADIAEIKKDGIKKKVDLHFACDGYELVKIDNEHITSKDPDDALKELLQTLSERERLAVIHRLGLFNNNEVTFASIGKLFNVSASRARQIYMKTLRKLRHPSRKSLVISSMNKLLIQQVTGNKI